MYTYAHVEITWTTSFGERTSFSCMEVFLGHTNFRKKVGCSAISSIKGNYMPNKMNFVKVQFLLTVILAHRHHKVYKH